MVEQKKSKSKNKSLEHKNSNLVALTKIWVCVQKEQITSAIDSMEKGGNWWQEAQLLEGAVQAAGFIARNTGIRCG